MIRIEIEVSCPGAVQPVVFGARLFSTLATHQLTEHTDVELMQHREDHR